MARVAQTALVGCDPVLMLEGPIPATERLLEREGIGIDDVDVFEVNEAFASVVIAWQRTVGADPARANPNGGGDCAGPPSWAAPAASSPPRPCTSWSAPTATTAWCRCAAAGGLGTGTLLQRVN